MGYRPEGHTFTSPSEEPVYPVGAVEEAEFLGIGHGAHTWRIEAAAVGTARMNQKKREAAQCARIHGVDVVDEALGIAAAYGRFDTGDLASILGARTSSLTVHQVSESRSFAQGTRGRVNIGLLATTGRSSRPTRITATGDEADL